MKKMLLLVALLPLWAMSQTGTVITANRVFAKPDRVMEFEKALKSHAQKYHTGGWKWRVFTIESGPDFGGYHIVEGPHTWDEIDKRGDLGAEHMTDWMKNVMVNATEKGSSIYSVYRDDLSTIQLTDYTDKIAITHIYPKPGRSQGIEQTLSKFKKVWEASGQTIAVFEASSSGPAQFALVTRYKQGLKERERNFRKPMHDRFVAAYDEQSWKTYLEDVERDTKDTWSELLFFNADLSSK